VKTLQAIGSLKRQLLEVVSSSVGMLLPEERMDNRMDNRRGGGRGEGVWGGEGGVPGRGRGGASQPAGVEGLGD
jgi:hypothetical protein